MSVDKYIKIKTNQQPDGSLSYNTGQANTVKYIMNDEKCIYNIRSAVEYMENEEKTYSPDTYKRLITGWLCDPDTVTYEFKLAEQKYHAVKKERLIKGHKPNVAFHFINSYQGHPDPQLVHAMGLEFVKRFVGPDFQAIVCTHTNTDNYHNHILVNAYSITDPPRKFKDEYNLYKKARAVMNEISIEYGLPIITNEEKHPYNSWSERYDKEEYKAYKEQLKSDMKAASMMTSDYTSFIAKMESLGYEVIQNKSSTSFRKEDISLRDTTVSSALTKNGLEQEWSKQRKNLERIENREKLNKLWLENALKYKKYDKVFIPKWDEYGNYQSFFKRLLLLIKRFVSIVSDTFYCEEMSSLYPDNIKFQSAKNRLKKIDEALRLLDKYNIKSDVGLKLTLQEVGAEMNQIQRDIQVINSYIANAEPLVDDIKRLSVLEELLKEAGFNLSSISLPYFDEETIRQNLSDLEPMTPKTKSRLYEKMHNSDYRLAVSFNQLKESEAREIIDFLRAPDNVKVKPDLLLSKDEYTVFLAKKDLAELLHQWSVDDNQPASQEYIDLIVTWVDEAIERLEVVDLKDRTDEETKELFLLKSFKESFNPSTLSYTMGTRILSKLMPNPFPAPTVPPPCCDSELRATKEQFLILCQIKKAYPDEFSHINPSHFSSEDADRLVLYALAKQDNVFQEYITTKGDKLKLSIFPPELQDLIKEYRKVKSNVLSYGIENGEEFINEYERIQKSVITKKVNYDIVKGKYQEIKTLQYLIDGVNNQDFVYGAAYMGGGEEFNSSKAALGSPQLDRLLEIRKSLIPIIENTDLSTLSNSPIDSTTFIPPSPKIKLILLELQKMFPGDFKNLNIQTINEYEAFYLIKELFERDEISKELDRILADELSEENQKDIEVYKEKLLEPSN